MLPNKEYFHISAIISGSNLHKTMRYLEQMKAYNVQVITFVENHESPEVQPKRSDTKRDMRSVKEAIIVFLTKNGPTHAKDILTEVGEPRNFGLLNRMAAAKQIKKTGKPGVYKV